MKKIKKFTLKLVLVSLVFLAFSCSELIDCIAKASPVFSTNQLDNGSIGINYNEYINSEVRNDPNDDAYDYYYSVEGNLPPGINYHTQGRKLYFTGNPTTSGSYTFKVFLTIDYPDYYDSNQGIFDDNNRICFGDDHTSKNFTIIIN
jgi:hypothetical protein